MDIIEKDGIFYRKWAVKSPECVLLLIHGLGAHGDRWSFMAEYFLRKNISSYALELRGFGESPYTKGHIDSFNIYYEDICKLREIIVKETSCNKIFIAGESLGALIAFILCAKTRELFNGLICISPAFVSKMKASLLTYINLLISLAFNAENKITVPFNSAMCTRDKDYQKTMDTDKRELRFATAKLLFNIFRGQIESCFLKNKINTNTLFLVAGKDKMVSAKKSKEVFQSIAAKDKTIIEYPDMYHALSIDLDRDNVFYDTYSWIKKRI